MQIIKIILSVIFIIETYWGKNKGRSMEGGLVKATTIMGILFFVISVALNMLG